MAVVAVMVVVSVPRLRSLALLENEADACSTAQLLVAALRSAPTIGAGAPQPSASSSLGALLERKDLAQVTSDAEMLVRGALMRRHGYLFELTTMPVGLSLASARMLPAQQPPGTGLVRAVRAWPWKHGATGCVAFLAAEDGALFMHGNQERNWDGAAAAGQRTDNATDWVRLP